MNIACTDVAVMKFKVLNVLPKIMFPKYSVPKKIIKEFEESSEMLQKYENFYDTFVA